MSKNLIILITVIGLILIVYNLGRLFFPELIRGHTGVDHILG